jgi:hypothetical protein
VIQVVYLCERLVLVPGSSFQNTLFIHNLLGSHHTPREPLVRLATHLRVGNGLWFNHPPRFCVSGRGEGTMAIWGPSLHASCMRGCVLECVVYTFVSDETALRMTAGSPLLNLWVSRSKGVGDHLMITCETSPHEGADT